MCKVEATGKESHPCGFFPPKAESMLDICLMAHLKVNKNLHFHRDILNKIYNLLYFLLNILLLISFSTYFFLKFENLI